MTWKREQHRNIHMNIYIYTVYIYIALYYTILYYIIVYYIIIYYIALYQIISLTKMRAACKWCSKQMAMACKERRAFSNESRPSALQSQHMVHGCANDQSLGTKLHTPFIFGIGL